MRKTFEEQRETLKNVREFLLDNYFTNENSEWVLRLPNGKDIKATDIDDSLLDTSDFIREFNNIVMRFIP
jgi:hypothetical protein